MLNFDQYSIITNHVCYRQGIQNSPHDTALPNTYLLVLWVVPGMGNPLRISGEFSRSRVAVHQTHDTRT